MPTDLDFALTEVENYIRKVDELIIKSYKIGLDEKRELNTSIQNFIRTAFLDGEAKLKYYKRSVNFYIGIIGYEETEQEKQEDYISRLKTMRNHLVAYRDELKLKTKMSSPNESKSIIKTTDTITDLAQLAVRSMILITVVALVGKAMLQILVGESLANLGAVIIGIVSVFAIVVSKRVRQEILNLIKKNN